MVRPLAPQSPLPQGLAFELTTDAGFPVFAQLLERSEFCCKSVSRIQSFTVYIRQSHKLIPLSEGEGFQHRVKSTPDEKNGGHAAALTVYSPADR